MHSTSQNLVEVCKARFAYNFYQRLGKAVRGPESILSQLQRHGDTGRGQVSPVCTLQGLERLLKIV